jgi:hypothetical protein
MEWRCQSDGNGPEVTARFDLRPAGDGTAVVLSVLAPDAADSESVARIWRHALDNLKAYVETGRNERLLRRPMLGIVPEAVTKESAAAKGLGVDHGLLLTEVVPDKGASAAGLAVNDVLVSIGERALTDWGSLTAALDAYRAGESVEVTYWRGTEQRRATVGLSGRERPVLPVSADDVSALVRQKTGEMVAALTEAMAGVTEPEAERRPAEGEWSAKDALAHLSLTERYGHDALSRSATDDVPLPWGSDCFDVRQKVLSRMLAPDLVQRVIADLRETESLALEVLSGAPSTPIVYEVSTTFDWGPEHVYEHVAQIREAVAAARDA